MKYFGLAIVAIVLASCSDNQPQGNLLIDLNGTTSNTIYAYALPNISDAIDSASVHAGVYRFNTAEWAYGFYRLNIDSTNYIDIIANGDAPICICARTNHLQESSTNNAETSLLWRIEHLQTNADTISRLTDSLRIVVRQQADRIRSRATNSIAMLPLLNLHVQNNNVYNMVSDHDIFEAALPTLQRIADNNATATTIISQTEKSRKAAYFTEHYQKNSKLPPFSFNTINGYALTPASFAGTSFVIYYSTDTTTQGAQHWENIASVRFANQKVVACVPQEQAKAQKINVFTGSFDAQTTQMLSSVEPVAIYVDNQGNITKINLLQ